MKWHLSQVCKRIWRRKHHTSLIIIWEFPFLCSNSTCWFKSYLWRNFWNSASACKERNSWYIYIQKHDALVIIMHWESFMLKNLFCTPDIFRNFLYFWIFGLMTDYLKLTELSALNFEKQRTLKNILHKLKNVTKKIFFFFL